MGPVKFTIEGLAELQVALRELPDATAKNVLRRVGKQALQPIADAAAQRAPVDQGTLRDSIHVGTKLSRRQKSKHKKISEDDVEVFVGAGPVPQAIWQEFGTVNHPAHPFLRPAWDAGKDTVINTIADLLWVEIQKSAARIARKAAKGA